MMKPHKTFILCGRGPWIGMTRIPIKSHFGSSKLKMENN
uniref:Uncharacterized protein n=1 Tax=Lepeophtheirus salmonis TaxID=72036 RepID=A0A0K2VF64_LEPSM